MAIRTMESRKGEEERKEERKDGKGKGKKQIRSDEVKLVDVE